ncbi:MAG: hypothetical protein DHS20C09_00300 [marine bacterium B5-7]|nr:MAG: hypothetical protein DHS20C09_00300 [marine bacterium B5-7]
MKKLIRFGLLFMICGNAVAAPSAKDLLAACEESLVNGFHGTTGMMCSWYVSPCDCHLGKDSVIPRVCLTGNESEESLARLVVDSLKAEPALQSKLAEIAVGIILSLNYPCD